MYIPSLINLKKDYPSLFKLRKAVNLESTLYKAIDAKIDERGSLRNNASPALQQIRTDIFKAQAQLRKQVEKIYKEASANKFTPEDASITVRDGRIVIPVLAEYKRTSQRLYS